MYASQKHNMFPYAGLLLGPRRRRWANIDRALGERVVLAGKIMFKSSTDIHGYSEHLKNFKSFDKSRAKST